MRNQIRTWTDTFYQIGISILIFRFNWKINIVCKQMQRNDITKYLEKWIRMQRFSQLNDVSSSF